MCLTLQMNLGKMERMHVKSANLFSPSSHPIKQLAVTLLLSHFFSQASTSYFDPLFVVKMAVMFYRNSLKLRHCAYCCKFSIPSSISFSHITMKPRENLISRVISKLY